MDHMIVEDFTAMILAGDLDSYLGEIEGTIAVRRALKSDERGDRNGFKCGQKIRLKNLRPKYLVGQVLDVVKVNDKTVVVNFPNDPSRYRRFAGSKGVRIPKASAEIVR